MRDSDDWRGVLQRLLEVEREVQEVSSRVEQNSERQKLQHEENRSENLRVRESLERVGVMLVGQKGNNGILGTVSTLSGDVKLLSSEISNVKEGVDDLKATLKHLPKTILIILSIIGTILALIQFLGPPVRRAIGWNAASAPYHILDAEGKSQNASLPSNYLQNAGGN